MKPHWISTIPDSLSAKELSQQLNVHPITAQILINRGLKTKEAGEIFLRPRLSHLPDPFTLPDMEKAVERIIGAIKSNEKITVFGDYDADGITSTALLVRFLRSCRANVDYYIPNRLSEGYGLNKKGISEIKERKSSLIITVDNGTNSYEEIEYACSLGMDVVVTDHHEVSAKLPPALAIVNPRRLTKGQDLRELAGVGVAFYLAVALRAKLRSTNFFGTDEPDLKNYLDLVAIGTIADVAPLTGVNRILVKHGLDVLKKSVNHGLTALAEAASTDLDKIDTSTVAFRLAPRINAAGRLGNQNIAARLLLTDDRNEAVELSVMLDKMNAERQALEKKIFSKMEESLSNLDDLRSSIVLWSEEWHPGVIGIVASRLSETHRKPCVLISIEGNSGRGSVRSIGNFNVMETLNTCAGVLKNYGGHAGAAGFDIGIENLDEFSKLFEEHASTNLSEEDRLEMLPIDAEIDIRDVTKQLVEELDALAPFGEENPEPLFATNDCTAEGVRIVGTNHLKFKIKNEKTSLDAIGFNLGDVALEPDTRYLFAGIPQLNYWNEMTTLQFKLRDIKPA